MAARGSQRAPAAASARIAMMMTEGPSALHCGGVVAAQPKAILSSPPWTVATVATGRLHGGSHLPWTRATPTASAMIRTAMRPAGGPLRSPEGTSDRAGSRVDRLVITRDSEQGYHNLVIQGPSGFFHDVHDGGGMWQRLTVGPRRGQRIVDIGDRDDACA